MMVSFENKTNPDPQHCHCRHHHRPSFSGWFHFRAPHWSELAPVRNAVKHHTTYMRGKAQKGASHMSGVFNPPSSPSLLLPTSFAHLQLPRSIGAGEKPGKQTPAAIIGGTPFNGGQKFDGLTPLQKGVCEKEREIVGSLSLCLSVCVVCLPR